MALIDQMNPDASTLALSSIEVDLSRSRRPDCHGQVARRPGIIRHRTKKEMTTP